MRIATMYFRLLCLLLATLFWSVGCAVIHSPVQTPETAKSDICLDIAAIPETMKLDIYRDIAAIVAAQLRAGDKHVRLGEFYEALASYKAAYAYDEQQEGLLAKIVALDLKVTKESDRLYERGRGYLATDKERALVAFNAAIRLNPAHVEARTAYEELREDQAIKAKLAELEVQLQQESATYAARPGELQSLLTKNEALLSYDFMNKTAMRLVPRLYKEKKRQVASDLAESEKLFAAGKLARSKAILKKAQIMAPDNDRIEELIKKVQLRQDIGYLLKLARDRVQQHDSRKGVIYASRILSLEPTHHEAREILSQVLQARQAKPPLATTPIPEQREFISALATIRQLCLAEKNDEEAAKLARLAENGLQQEVFVMLERGQALYAQKAFVDAQAIFEYVDEIDPGNEQAQAFIKKIENRLETLDSLQ